MTFIRRTRPSAAPAPAPLSRLRRARPATTASRTAAARKSLDEDLKLIAEIERELDDASARLEEVHARADATMRANNLSEHSDGVYKATVEEAFSRQDTTIDPKKFKNAVADKDFWACITVGVTKAQDLLGKKEIASISDIKPAKSLGYRFNVKPVKKK